MTLLTLVVVVDESLRCRCAPPWRRRTDGARDVDCPSCGAAAQNKAHCEVCGFTFPVDTGAGDSALSLFLGLVCEACDTYNDPGSTHCAGCGAALEPLGDLDVEVPALVDLPPTQPSTALRTEAPPAWMTPPSGNQVSLLNLPKVDLSQSIGPKGPTGLAAPRSAPHAAPPAAPGPNACWRCGTMLALDDRFCRSCGARVGDAPAAQGTSAIALNKVMPGPGAPPSGATMVMPAFRAAQQAPSASATSGQTLVFGVGSAERVPKLILVRGKSKTGSQWRLSTGETVIGRSIGSVLFPDDASLAPRHARLVLRGEALWLEPEASTNGVFVRLREPVRLQHGDDFIVGAERLRVLNPEEGAKKATTTRDGTTRLGSLMKAQPAIALMRIAATPAHNEVYYRPQRLLTLGRANCDINFVADGFVSERHAQVTHAGDHLVLEDLRSRNGTYVRARGPQRLQHGDLLLLGDEVLRVEFPIR